MSTDDKVIKFKVLGIIESSLKTTPFIVQKYTLREVLLFQVHKVSSIMLIIWNKDDHTGHTAHYLTNLLYLISSFLIWKHGVM